MNPKLKKIVEALLISTSEPLSIQDMLKLFRKYEEQLVDSKDSSDEEGEIENEEENVNLRSIKKKDLELVLQAIMEEAEVGDLSYRLVDGPKGFYFATAPSSRHRDDCIIDSQAICSRNTSLQRFVYKLHSSSYVSPFRLNCFCLSHVVFHREARGNLNFLSNPSTS